MDHTPFSESKRGGSPAINGYNKTPFTNGGGTTSMGHSTAITKMSKHHHGDVTFTNLNSQRDDMTGEGRVVESRGKFSISFSPNNMNTPINEAI